jgi:hypothetical protein
MVKDAVDIHNFEKRLIDELNRLKRANIDSENKELITDFIQDLQDGWIPQMGRKKSVDKARWPKYAMHLRVIGQIIQDNGITPKSFRWLDKDKAKQLKKLLIKRLKPQSKKKNSWKTTAYDYKVIFKKFMRWVREEKGYPKGYQEKQRHLYHLDGSIHPLELKPIDFTKPSSNGNLEIYEIPTDEELQWLYEASVNLRDKCYFAMWKEHGNRIGGIGSLQIKDIESPDNLGILVTMRDKTLDGEQIRFIHAQADIITYLNSHPRRLDPEAPFWYNLDKWNKKSIFEHLEYPDFDRIIKRAQKRHNRKFRDNREKQITKKLRTHLARYAAFRRKRKQGVPAHVICTESGLVDGSKQLEYYGKFDRSDVDDYYRSVVAPEETRIPELRTCPRCKQVQKGVNGFCERCGSPMDVKAALKLQEENKTLEDRLKQLEEKAKVNDYLDGVVQQLLDKGLIDMKKLATSL